MPSYTTESDNQQTLCHLQQNRSPAFIKSHTRHIYHNTLSHTFHSANFSGVANLLLLSQMWMSFTNDLSKTISHSFDGLLVLHSSSRSFTDELLILQQHGSSPNTFLEMLTQPSQMTNILCATCNKTQISSFHRITYQTKLSFAHPHKFHLGVSGHFIVVQSFIMLPSQLS